MQINVSGKQLDIGSSFTSQVEEDIRSLVSKYFDKAIKSHVVFTKNRHLYQVHVEINEGTGTNIFIKADAQDKTIQSCFELVKSRLEKRLRKYKTKIKNHHKSRLDKEGILGTKYVISEPADDVEETSCNQEPLIIAEKQTQIETLSVSDAVMRMDLGNLPALMFINVNTGSINVIYRREDGNISWIDSKLEGAAKKVA